MEVEHELLTDEFCEHLFYVMYGDEQDDRVSIDRVIRHDVINRTFHGTIEVEGVTYWFEADDGNRCGSQITHFATHPSDREPEPIYSRRYFPVDPHCSKAQQLYMQWRRTGWFQEKERALNYDSFFAPGDVTRRHYDDWAESHGLTVICVEVDSKEDPDSPNFKMPPARKEPKRPKRKKIDGDQIVADVVGKLLG